jgi:hypothetical protein
MTVNATIAFIVAGMVPRAVTVIARSAELYPHTTRSGVHVYLRKSRHRCGGDESACGDKTKCNSFHCDLLFRVSLCLPRRKRFSK